jgi:hypothetical protein
MFEGLNRSEKANHSRWCLKNPKNDAYKNALKKAREFITEESIDKIKTKVKEAHSQGKYKEAPNKALKTRISNGNLRHTEESKQKIREKALSSNHRRILRSTRKYLKKDGSVVLLDSSWEEALAIRLDELDIDCVRPGPIVWVDKDNKPHNYFPDFYLIEYDLYLDPKNDIVYERSLEKIEVLKRTLPNLRFIRNLEECKKKIVSDGGSSPSRRTKQITVYNKSQV